MKTKILLFCTFISISIFAVAQNNNVTYAITGSNTHDSLWKNICVFNSSTGSLIRTIPVNTTNDLVAAIAYDKKASKLFFCTLKTGELKWINLNENAVLLNVYQLQAQQFSTKNNPYDESDNVTRMCMGNDGNGYAVSNDGNHFYSFTTTNNIVITDLGNLIDDATNGGTSVHNQCTSWGGDMVADAYGKLYLITANHFVFKIDITTKIATLLGSISGLPNDFSTNGAAVAADGNVLVASALGREGFFKVDLTNLVATKVLNSNKNYAISDLASSNLLFQNVSNITATAKTFAPTSANIYPNPIIGNSFNLILNNQKTGDYIVTVSDLQGRPIQSTKVAVSETEKQTLLIHLFNKPANGSYLVKVMNVSGAVVFMDKLIVD